MLIGAGSVVGVVETGTNLIDVDGATGTVEGTASAASPSSAAEAEIVPMRPAVATVPTATAAAFDQRAVVVGDRRAAAVGAVVAAAPLPTEAAETAAAVRGAPVVRDRPAADSAARRSAAEFSPMESVIFDLRFFGVVARVFITAVVITAVVVA